jgi:hypothetical protein
VKSFLEWKEAILLLTFRPAVNMHSFQNIRDMHAMHTLLYAKEDLTEVALTSVINLHTRGDISKNDLCSVLAGMVENDASNLKYWVSLACTLGPLGKRHKIRSKCKRGCEACGRLRHRIYFDHKDDENAKKVSGWWGDGLEWWNSHFFDGSLKPKAEPKRKQERRKKRPIVEENKFEIVRQALKAVVQSKTLQPSRNSGCSEDREAKRSQPTDLSWLWSIEPSDLDEEDVLEDDDENISYKTFDALLPQKCNRSIGINGDSFDKDMKGHCICIACKVLVTCHLFDVTHLYVDHAIWYLARNCCVGEMPTLRVDENSSEFRALMWLESKGMNTCHILRSASRHEI